jgi:hypothetical protein
MPTISYLILIVFVTVVGIVDTCSQIPESKGKSKISNRSVKNLHQCSCQRNPEVVSSVDCDVNLISRGAKLYWQVNCKRAWLTLEQKTGTHILLDEIPFELASDTYRLGFHLIREFKETLLFRGGCPANGPCIYSLINKTTGKLVRRFPQLIQIDTDTGENPRKYPYDFVVYLSDDMKWINVYFVNKKRSVRSAFRDRLTGIIPAYEFTDMKVERDQLVMKYNDGSGKKVFRMKIN